MVAVFKNTDPQKPPDELSMYSKMFQRVRILVLVHGCSSTKSSKIITFKYCIPHHSKKPVALQLFISKVLQYTVDISCSSIGSKETEPKSQDAKPWV
jgi:hypothetical protein